MAKQSHFECRPCFPTVRGTFGVCCAWAVREKRCGSVGVDRFAATEPASIAAMRVGVEVGVLGERVRVVVDRAGVPGGHGGRVGGCGDGCGSGGTVLRPTEVFTKSFGIGPSVAATGQESPQRARKAMPSCCVHQPI